MPHYKTLALVGIAISLFAHAPASAQSATLADSPADVVAKFNTAANAAGASSRLAFSECHPNCIFIMGNDVVVQGITSNGTTKIKTMLLAIPTTRDAKEFFSAIGITMHAFARDASDDEVYAAQKQLLNDFKRPGRSAKISLHGVDWSMIEMPQAGVWVTVQASPD